MPSRTLLTKPYPDNLPVVTICKACNESFSLDEEYFSIFLSCVLSGSTVPQDQLDERAKRALERNPKLKSRIEKSKNESNTISGGQLIVWKPEEKRIKNIVLKNARGHAFYEYGEPILEEPKHIWAVPLVSLSDKEREEFENINNDKTLLWPEVGSRMMTRALTGQDMWGEWILVQKGYYR